MSYLRSCWYMVGWAADIQSKPVPFTLLNEPIVLYRGADGQLVAFEDRCPHKLAPLSLGRVEGNDLRCMYHGLKFAPQGHCVEIPGQAAIPSALRAKSYPIFEAHSAAWVWMGDPARADPELIPPFVGVDDPDWRLLGGRMDYDVHYSLINDNLLDLSHVAFVHSKSFGAGEERPADPKKHISFARRTTERLPRGLRITRIIEDAPANPLLREPISPLGDTWSVVQFLAPGIFLMNSDLYRSGAVARANGQRPADDELLHRSFTCQAVTPMTDRKSCYHFAIGPWSRSPLSAEPFHAVAEKAFIEDKVMITAQQRVIDASAGIKPKLLPIDKQGGEFAAIMRRLIDEEQRLTSAA